MSLVVSPSLATFSDVLKSTSIPSESYVLSLASLPSCYAASASSPSNAIHLFDKSDLRVLSTLGGHEGGVTSLKSVDALAGSTAHVLISSGIDGTVKVWDDRSGATAIHMRTSGKSQPILSCDVSSDGLTVAAGTGLEGEDALIRYWDPRNPAAPLRTHSSTHSDDITALQFCPHSSYSFNGTEGRCKNILLSVSSDGLVCTSNPDEEDEDEATLNVGNWGCSIAQAGWLSPNSTGVPAAWTSSDMETFSVWSGEMSLIQDLDIRNPSSHTSQLTWVTDYLIGCHTSASIGSDLSVFVGSNEGDVALITSSDLSSSQASWSVLGVWSTGHVGVVRSFLWDEKNNVLLTGGEDSKLNLWSAPHPRASTNSPAGDDAMDIDSENVSQPSRKRELDFGMGRRSPTLDHGGKRARQL